MLQSQQQARHKLYGTQVLIGAVNMQYSGICSGPSRKGVDCTVCQLLKPVSTQLQDSGVDLPEAEPGSCGCCA